MTTFLADTPRAWVCVKFPLGKDDCHQASYDSLSFTSSFGCQTRPDRRHPDVPWTKPLKFDKVSRRFFMRAVSVC